MRSDSLLPRRLPSARRARHEEWRARGAAPQERIPPRRVSVAGEEHHRYCRIAARLAANHYEVTQRELFARSVRTRRVARARHVAIYLAHVAFGVSLGAAAAAFGRDRKTVAYACRVIEDARDAPAFDAALAGLERTARVLLELEREKAAA